MSPTGKRILFPHLPGQLIRTTADHPFYVVGQGWTEVCRIELQSHLLPN